MTIPVERPPRYEVGARPAPANDEEARLAAQAAASRALSELEARRTSAGAVWLGRGCLASVMLLGVLATCCGGAVLWGVAGGGFDAAMSQALGKVVADLRAVATEQGSIDRHRGALDQLEEIRSANRLSWIAAAVLWNRWFDARADEHIDEAELAHLMELVRDIDAGNGRIDPSRYPGGR